jgi:lipid-A-disaccharide synthase
MMEAGRSFSEFQIVIAGAPCVEKDFYHSILTEKNVQIIFSQTYELLSHARMAIVNSGTATLETALLNIPQIVVYQMFGGKFINFLKNHILKVQYISLVNLIAEKTVVPELVAHEFSVGNMLSKMPQMLYDERFRANFFSEYALISNKLGKTGAAKRAAKEIFNALVFAKKL